MQMEKISKELRFKDNPRVITEQQRERLAEHLEELGDLSGVVYCRNNKAYAGGNQRSVYFDGCKIILTEKYPYPTKTGTVALGWIEKNGERYAYREVDWTEEQFLKACIVANNDGGDWDYTVLEKWDQGALSDWGFEMPAGDGKPERLHYTRKINTPIYEPKSEKPPVGSLADDEKTRRLVEEIKASTASREIKAFLIKAAQRHTVFDFEKIADFYAHSSKEVQELMEKSALVIIDFEKAIEYGFLQMSEDLRASYLQDYEG